MFKNDEDKILQLDKFKLLAGAGPTGDRVQFTLNNSNSLQGYMVWNKATNTMRWTDGFQTYTYSSCGLQRRLNTQSWLWEHNPQVIVRGEVPPQYCGLA